MLSLRSRTGHLIRDAKDNNFIVIHEGHVEGCDRHRIYPYDHSFSAEVYTCREEPKVRIERYTRYMTGEGSEFIEIAKHAGAEIEYV